MWVECTHRLIQLIRLFIEGNEWVIPDDNSLEIPKVLEPGERYTFPGQLEFKIKDYICHQEESRRWPFSV